MQKKLLGMAVAAALAGPTVAAAQVQVYGTANFTLNQTTYSSSGAVGSVKKFAVNSHGSNYGIRSTETLGGGLTAWLQAEFNLKNERENDLASGQGTARNSGVGIRGGFGNFYVGTWETPWTQTFRLWDVGTIGGYGPTTSIIGRRETTGSQPSRNCGNAFAAGSAVTAGSIPTMICTAAEPGTLGGVAGAYPLWRRYGAGVFYESPVFAGVQGKFAYQPNETKTAAGATNPATGSPVTQEDPSSWSASLTWTGMGGNARAFIATMSSEEWTTVGQTDSGFTVGGGYNLGVVNVGATYETYKYKTATGDSKATQYGLGLAYPIGAGKIGVSYAVAKDLEGGALGGDNGAKMWNIGYEHGLSKRTAVSVGYAKIDNDPGARFTWTGMAPAQDGASTTQPAGSDPSNLFVGIRHSF
jgi:predicted porin